MNTNHSIETRYQGYRFRSRLEARWATFLTAMDEPWEYEKEGFRLSNGELYLPDFWLPRLHLWLEIKGQPPTEEELCRCRLLRDQTQAAVAIFYGLPDEYVGQLYCWDLNDSSAGSSEWEASLTNDHDGHLSLWVETRKQLFADPLFDKLIELYNGCVKVEIASQDARAARFEFGEET